MHGLSALPCSYLTLKREQLSFVKAVYVWLLMGLGSSICYQILLFVFDHKLDVIGSGKSSAVLIISPMVSLMVN